MPALAGALGQGWEQDLGVEERRRGKDNGQGPSSGEGGDQNLPPSCPGSREVSGRASGLERGFRSLE